MIRRIVVFMIFHDDVIKWKYFPHHWPFVRGIHRSPVNSLHKGQWRRALIFSLICVWINGWVNNREAGDLRRYRVHYDVSVMFILFTTGRQCPDKTGWASLVRVNSSPPGQNGCRFADGIFRCIFLNEKLCIFIKISLKFVPKGPIGNNSVLV